MSLFPIRNLDPIVRAFALAGALVLAMQALPVGAQTTPAVCEQDSLRLLSPDRDGMRVSLSRGQRFGAVVQWADLDDAITTCAVPIDTAGFGPTVYLDGAYADIVDRKLRFTTSFGGVVGSPDVNSVLLTWSNVNQQFTGQISGEVNLSNNGGLRYLPTGDTEWARGNAGLPQFMTRMDMNAFAVSPRVDGRYLVHPVGRLGRGLWYKPDHDSDWRRIGADLFPDLSVEEWTITAAAFSPEEDGTFVIGTSNEGLYLTRDGGATFTQIRDELSAVGSWNRRSVTAIDWTAGDELLVAVRDLGLFISDDGGVEFDLLDSFVVPAVFPTSSQSVPPTINALVNAGGGRYIAAIENFGIYETINGGADWEWKWTELLAPGASPTNALRAVVDPADPDVLLVASRTQGIFRTDDNGDDWDQIEYFNLDGDLETIDVTSAVNGLIWDSYGSRFLAAHNTQGLLSSVDGVTWEMPAGLQTGIRTVKNLLAGDGVVADVLMPSYAGGIYVPGTALNLSDTIKKNLTQAGYRNLDFGMTIAFSDGVVPVNGGFGLLFQDFQGYAVWRSEIANPEQLELVGVFDKNNPESCIEGYCGAPSYNVVQRCYADKRAACFDFSDPDTVKFFDNNIYDGFVYQYAVTTFDYGNTATASPSSMNSDQLFSSRYTGDPLTIFPGEGNLMEFRVNLEAAEAAGEEEIYVVPNPLRHTSAGMTQGLAGREIHFRNLPPESRVQVFTVDGDLVADLSSDTQQGHTISWLTEEDLASGVYIYKVEMPSRDDYFGKLVVIK